LRIAIIGSGRIGSTVADLVASAGHEVAIANSRGPEWLDELVAELGFTARAATVEDAAEFGELVVLAIPLHAYPSLPADALAGKIVVDAGNYYPERDGTIAKLDDESTTSSELLAARLPGARIVKAFNTMYFETLGAEARPEAPRGQRLTLFLAGDDEDAKRLVADLIEELGFAAVDSGSLADGGRRQQPGAPLYNRPLAAADAERALEALPGA
jgi:predicted dinucleotide-binding enzyme